MNERVLEKAEPQNMMEVRTIVRTWYGNLPVEILVLNKKLQKVIIEFEKMCERGSFDFVSFTEKSHMQGLAE